MANERDSRVTVDHGCYSGGSSLAKMQDNYNS